MFEHPDAPVTFDFFVRCALEPEQEIAAIDIEGQIHGPWQGELGLAPAWFDAGNGVQTVAEQESVSACMLALSNIISADAVISMRAVSLPPPTAVETALYSRSEAHFFGNLLSENPVKETCRELDSSSLATIQELTNVLRMCAIDTYECGFTAIGDCASVCTGWDATQNMYQTCNGRPAVATFIEPA